MFGEAFLDDGDKPGGKQGNMIKTKTLLLCTKEEKLKKILMNDDQIQGYNKP